MDPNFAKMLLNESEADIVEVWTSSVIPGMLQTADYARAMFRANIECLDDATLDFWIKVRIDRHRMINKLHALIDEAALHRLVGGRSVMYAQLLHLLQIANRPDVELRVMPFSAGAHAGSDGDFTIFRFDGPPEDDVVCVDHSNSIFLHKGVVLDIYERKFRFLQEKALPSEESMRLIQMIAEDEE